MQIQIDDSSAFTPDVVLSAGYEHGFVEKTKPEDKVRGFICSTRFVILHYVYQGLEVKQYYKNGKWMMGEENMPLFHVTEALL
jgi:hypothetical protein